MKIKARPMTAASTQIWQKTGSHLNVRGSHLYALSGMLASSYEPKCRTRGSRPNRGVFAGQAYRAGITVPSCPPILAPTVFALGLPERSEHHGRTRGFATTSTFTAVKNPPLSAVSRLSSFGAYDCMTRDGHLRVYGGVERVHVD